MLVNSVLTLTVHLGRPLSLTAESDRNDPRLVTPREAGGYGLTAQWADDVHHALHALLTGERQGYYVDFGSLECLADVLQEVFVHAGTWSTLRGQTHRSEEHTSELQSQSNLVCRLLLEKKKTSTQT